MRNSFKKILYIFTFIAVIWLGFVSQANISVAADDPLTGRASNSSSGGCQVPKTIEDLFNYALCVLDGAVIPFLVGLGLILFIAGVIKFVAAGDNEEKRQGGRDMMIFGIISLFVMLSVWGFVNILSNSFFGKNAKILGAPEKSNKIFAQF